MIDAQLEDRRATLADDPALTRKQAAILAEIVRFRQTTGENCRAAYLARRFSLSRAGMQAHIDALRRKGWLRSQDSPLRLRQSS